MNAAAEHRAFSYRMDRLRRDLILDYLEIEVSPAAWQEVRNYIAAVAKKERTEALAEGRHYADQVCRELGLPTRLEDSMRQVVELRMNFTKFAAEMEQAARAVTGIARRLNADDPTPIFDALKAERGAA